MSRGALYASGGIIAALLMGILQIRMGAAIVGAVFGGVAMEFLERGRNR